ncbi:hypothetical protein BDZ89DRAFT_224153 [Hymenopellis radicata]|nr:hypothetical protein BDZ89DRAFT_224153 [Hymenopellis radicata]
MDQVITFHSLAPRVGAYVQEIHFQISRRKNRKKIAGLPLRAALKDLFPLLPNIQRISTPHFSVEHPFTPFTNDLLVKCQRLREFEIVGAINVKHVSCATLFSTFSGTTVKKLHLCLSLDGVSSPIEDYTLNSDSGVCHSIESLVLSRGYADTKVLTMLFPLLPSILPRWRELKVNAGNDTERQTWSDFLRTSSLPRLRRFHIQSIFHNGFIDDFEPHPYSSSPLLSSAPFDHLLFTFKATLPYCLDIRTIEALIQWYLCTFAALAQGEKSTFKELTFTVMFIHMPIIVAAWEKLDDVLSTPAFSSLERVHFVILERVKVMPQRQEPINAWSSPDVVCMLEKAWPRLSSAGKLAF